MLKGLLKLAFGMGTRAEAQSNIQYLQVNEGDIIRENHRKLVVKNILQYECGVIRMVMEK